MSNKVKLTGITITSGVSSRTHEGFIEIGINGERVQLNPQEARRQALIILETADAAETDEFLFAFLEYKVGLTGIEERSAVLHEFRHYREQMADKREKRAGKSEMLFDDLEGEGKH